MIQITRQQANVILHNMLWKMIKADNPPTKDEQETIEYLRNEVNKISTNVPNEAIPEKIIEGGEVALPTNEQLIQAIENTENEEWLRRVNKLGWQ